MLIFRQFYFAQISSNWCMQLTNYLQNIWADRCVSVCDVGRGRGGVQRVLPFPADKSLNHVQSGEELTTS